MANSEADVQKVWEKAIIDSSNDPNVFRKDRCGAWIKRTDYGNRNSIYGWEVDHIKPNGGDGLANLQPLHWQNNVAKGDGPLVCAVVSEGTRNVARTR